MCCSNCTLGITFPGKAARSLRVDASVQKSPGSVDLTLQHALHSVRRIPGTWRGPCFPISSLTYS